MIRLDLLPCELSPARRMIWILKKVGYRLPTPETENWWLPKLDLLLSEPLQLLLKSGGGKVSFLL